jgi:hypothetical protein
MYILTDIVRLPVSRLPKMLQAGTVYFMAGLHIAIHFAKKAGHEYCGHQNAQSTPGRNK